MNTFAARLCLVLLLPCAALPASAQYKVVGADGRVTYTDRPVVSTGERVTPLFRAGVTVNPPRAAAPASATASDGAALPFELRQVASRFPVQLITAADCTACDNGRRLLQQRGIPFSERTVQTEDDAAILQRQFGWRTVPTLSIGGQSLRGFSPAEWAGYLDAAGYPRESRLPRGWAAPAATPLAPAPRTAPGVSVPTPPELVTTPPTPPEEPASERPATAIRF